MGSLRVRQDSATSLSLFTFMHWRRKWQPTPVFLPGESQGWGSLMAVYGVAQSWTRLKRLSSSSSNPKICRSVSILFPADHVLGCMCACVCESLSHVWLFATLWTVAHQAPLSMEFTRQEYWVSFHSFLQGIFPTQGSNLGLPHCRWILYYLSHQGSPM